MGLLPNFASSWRASRTRMDDALDVFACHGAGSIWGFIATGIFASTTINPAGPNGAFYGNLHLLAVQAFAVGVVAAFAFFGSCFLLKVINYITPIRVSPEEGETGMDISQHGEEAYA